jgi:hypothetical protein
MTYSEAEINRLFEVSSEEMEQKRLALEERYGLGHFDEWKADLAVPEIRFIRSGRVEVRADIVVVGSFGRGTWQWGWANSSFPEHVRKGSEPMKKLAATTGLVIFEEGAWKGSLEQAWMIAALACRELGAEGVYRMPTAKSDVFALLFDVKSET